jgi:hypothetical protein
MGTWLLSHAPMDAYELVKIMQFRPRVAALLGNRQVTVPRNSEALHGSRPALAMRQSDGWRWLPAGMPEVCRTPRWPRQQHSAPTEGDREPTGLR